MDARRLWQLIEPVHAVTYFDPAARKPLQDKGITSFWTGYFLQRAAPLGPVGPAVVTAAFFGFHPRRAAAVFPAELSPAEAVQLRAEGAQAALTPHVEEVTALADLLWRAAANADCAGRVLAAANQALPEPTEPVAKLWQATTTLREHRGDGHLAALISHGIGPVAAMQLKVAAGESHEDDLRLGRGWSEQDWTDTAERLRRQGWVDEAGKLTEDGTDLRGDIETITDAAAAQPWKVLAAEELTRAVALLTPITQSVWDSGVVPTTNPVGVTVP